MYRLEIRKPTEYSMWQSVISRILRMSLQTELAFRRLRRRRRRHFT